MTLASEVTNHPLFPSRYNEYIRWYPKALQAPTERQAIDGHIEGAYVHVPFCDRLCRFCPFNKVQSNSAQMDMYIKALERECSMIAESVSGGPLAFVYLGGGTPSALPLHHIETLLATLDRHWGLCRDTEITMETHPTHANAAFLSSVRQCGVTRVSIGIQSFFADSLKRLGATHTVREGEAALDAALSEFRHVAIDLLYAYEGQTLEMWRSELSRALIEHSVPHLSCYPLVPPGGQLRASTGLEIELATEAFAMSHARGMRHYASCASGGFDVCMPGHECRYELLHWQAPQTRFVGLGPGAFGYTGSAATVNRLDVREYCDSLLESERLPLASYRPMSNVESRRRFFVIGLKALSVDLREYSRLFQRDAADDFAAEFKWLIDNRFAELHDKCLTLTPLGRLFVDMCCAAFFSSEERAAEHPEERQIRVISRRSNV